MQKTVLRFCLLWSFMLSYVFCNHFHHLDAFPPDIQDEILSKLSYRDRFQYLLSSKTSHRIINDYEINKLLNAPPAIVMEVDKIIDMESNIRFGERKTVYADLIDETMYQFGHIMHRFRKLPVSNEHEFFALTNWLHDMVYSMIRIKSSGYSVIGDYLEKLDLISIVAECKNTGNWQLIGWENAINDEVKWKRALNWLRVDQLLILAFEYSGKLNDSHQELNVVYNEILKLTYQHLLEMVGRSSQNIPPLNILLQNSISKSDYCAECNEIVVQMMKNRLIKLKENENFLQLDAELGFLIVNLVDYSLEFRLFLQAFVKNYAQLRSVNRSDRPSLDLALTLFAASKIFEDESLLTKSEYFTKRIQDDTNMHTLSSLDLLDQNSRDIVQNNIYHEFHRLVATYKRISLNVNKRRMQVESTYDRRINLLSEKISALWKSMGLIGTRGSLKRNLYQ